MGSLMSNAVDLSIFESELRLLTDLVSASPDRETGGELLGLWSHGGGGTVMLVTGPAPNALREATTYAQPPAVHMEIERFAWTRFGLQVLGIWHSHHHIGLRELSGGDRQRTREYSRTTGRRSYAEILSYLSGSGGSSRVHFRPYVYSDAERLKEVRSELRSLPGLSPVRAVLEATSPPELIKPCLFPDATVAGRENVELVHDPAAEDRHEAGSELKSAVAPVIDESPGPHTYADERTAPPPRSEVGADQESIARAFEAALGKLPTALREEVTLELVGGRVRLTLTGASSNRFWVLDLHPASPRLIHLTEVVKGRPKASQFALDANQQLSHVYATFLHDLREGPHGLLGPIKKWKRRTGS